MCIFGFLLQFAMKERIKKEYHLDLVNHQLKDLSCNATRCPSVGVQAVFDAIVHACGSGRSV